MGLFTDSTWEQFIPFFSYIGMFVLMSFFDWFYLQIGVDSKKAMRKNLFEFTPSRPAFSIWSVIFGGLALFTFMNCFNEYAGTFNPMWTSITFLLMVGWFATFSLEIYSLSTLGLMASIISSFQVILDIPKSKNFMELGSGYIMGIYMGWLISAALINSFIFIQQRGLGGKKSDVLNYIFVALLFLSHIAIVLLIRYETFEMCWPITLTLFWSVHWVLWKARNIEMIDYDWTYSIGYFLASGIVLTAILRVLIDFDLWNIDVDIDI